MTGNRSGRILRAAACTLVLAVAAVCLLSVASSDDSYAAEASGTCGTDLTWNLDSQGTLTISGTGAMTDWTSASAVPWHAHVTDIQSISIANGVTTIGTYAFSGCTSINTLVIPDSVTTLGEKFLTNCTSLNNFTIGAGVTNFSPLMAEGSNKVDYVQVAEGSTRYAVGASNLFSADYKSLIYSPPYNSNVYVADETERICSYAFLNSSMGTFESKNIKVYEDRAFYNASFVTDVGFYFKDCVTYVGSELWGDSIPSAITFHPDYKGETKDFIKADFYRHDGTKCTNIPSDLLGMNMNYMSGDSRYVVMRTSMMVKYLYVDGTVAADEHFEWATDSYKLTVSSPSVWGYTAQPESVDLDNSDLTPKYIKVIYSNAKYTVSYIVDEKTVMTEDAYYGHTVTVKEYNTGKKVIKDWVSGEVTIEDGKFVMPNMDVELEENPLDGGTATADAPENMAIGLAVAVAVVAAGLLVSFRRHRSDNYSRHSSIVHIEGTFR